MTEVTEVTQGSDRNARTATTQRRTKETTIDASLAVDGTGAVDVSTGLPFFDHMVEQLGRHASFDLSVAAQGDLHVDAHHLPSPRMGQRGISLLVGSLLRRENQVGRLQRDGQIRRHVGLRVSFGVTLQCQLTRHDREGQRIGGQQGDQLPQVRLPVDVQRSPCAPPRRPLERPSTAHLEVELRHLQRPDAFGSRVDRTRDLAAVHGDVDVSAQAIDAPDADVGHAQRGGAPGAATPSRKVDR